MTARTPTVPSATVSSATVSSAVARPSAADLDDLAARERWYLAEGWWTDETLPGYVLRHCHDDPAAEAVAGAGLKLSRGELARQVRQAGEAFRGLGVRPADRVLVQLPNEPVLIVVILGLAHIGAAAVLAVPGLRERELRHVTEVTQARALVVSDRAQRGVNLAVGRTLAASCPSVRSLIISGTAAALGPGEFRLHDLMAQTSTAGTSTAGTGTAGISTSGTAKPADVALYLLSGGTTGLPKPIPRTHRDYVYNLKVSAAAAGLDSSSRYLAALPVCHNFPLGCPGVLGTLGAGGRVVLTEARLVAATLAVMAQEGITIAAAVPGLAMRWAEQARLEPAKAARLKLKVLQVGGARLRGQHAPELAAQLGGTVQQVFGMAEGLLCFTRLDDPPEVVQWTQGRPASAGDEWRLTDEAGRSVPPGEPGELWARGPYTAGRYLASPAVNEAAFAPGGWYRTGDIVRQHPSGNFVVEGRRKDFINTGGEKVSAEEVEELVAAHPAVELAAAVAAPSELLDEEICVFVTLRPAAELGLRDLRRFMTGRGLAPYKLPARLSIVGELPATAVGKVDKAALRARARQLAQGETERR
jgi:2,3-dihydroxybenzoate-AMP ligase